MSSQNQPSHNEGGGLLLFLFILVSTGVILFFGWCAARANISYRVVRAIVFPATFFLSELMGTMLFVCVGWFIALLTGNTDMANYVLGKASELCLLSTLFGDPISIPVWHIILFQFLVWLLIMRPMGRMLTTSVYDAGIVSSAYDKGITPYQRRLQVYDNDTGYAKAWTYYDQAGTAPLLGLLFLAMSRCSATEYYNLRN